MKVIFIPRAEPKEKCPNCNSVLGIRGYQTMKCPACSAEFCRLCFVGIPEENGDTLRCPVCQIKLEFPDTPVP